MSRKSLALLFGLGCLIGGFFYWRAGRETESDQRGEILKGKKLEDSPVVDRGLLDIGITHQQYQSAESWIREKFPTEPINRDAVLLVLADRAIQEGAKMRAVECYRLVHPATSKYSLTALVEEGKLLVELNQADQAEAAFRKFIDNAKFAVELNPQQVLDAFKWLTYILSVQIRQEERKLLLKEQHQIGLADPLDSKQLFFPNLLILNSPAGRKKLAGFLENAPDNPRLLLASARYKTLEGNYEAAIEQLRSLQTVRAGDLRVDAALAEALFESGDTESLTKLLESLPSFSSGEPWLLTRMRAEQALDAKQWEVAVEHFQVVLQEDPANAPAQMGLAKAWAGLKKEDKRQEALNRSGIIAQIRVNLSSVQADAEVACKDLAEKCEQLGMREAAVTFRQHAMLISEQGRK